MSQSHFGVNLPTTAGQGPLLQQYSHIQRYLSFKIIVPVEHRAMGDWHQNVTVTWPRPNCLGKKKFNFKKFYRPHMFKSVNLIYLSDPLWAYGNIKIIKNLNEKSNLQLFSCKFQKWPRPICFLDFFRPINT